MCLRSIWQNIFRDRDRHHYHYNEVSSAEIEESEDMINVPVSTLVHRNYSIYQLLLNLSVCTIYSFIRVLIFLLFSLTFLTLFYYLTTEIEANIDKPSFINSLKQFKHRFSQISSTQQNENPNHIDALTAPSRIDVEVSKESHISDNDTKKRVSLSWMKDFSQIFEDHITTFSQNLSTSSIPFSQSDILLVKDLLIVWDMSGAVGCSGWAIECMNFMYGLSELIGENSLGLISSPYICSGLPNYILNIVNRIRNKNLNAKQIDIYIIHNTPMRYIKKFPHSSWNQYISRKPRYIIGRSMTEVHTISKDWRDNINQFVDEVWVPSYYQLLPFHSGGVELSKLFVIPESIDTKLFSSNSLPLSIRGSSEFNFLSVFKLEDRKGWDILIEAFFKEFSSRENISLFLHTYFYSGNDNDRRNAAKIQLEIKNYIHSLHLEKHRNNSILPYNSVHVISEELPTQLMPRLYSSMNAFVLSSHGEGFGLPMAESLSVGIPVIATNWSGQLEYLNEGNSYLIPVTSFEEARGVDFESNQYWATPSVLALQKIMRYVVNHRKEAREKGLRGAKEIKEKYSVQVIAKTIVKRLAQIKFIIQ